MHRLVIRTAAAVAAALMAVAAGASSPPDDKSDRWEGVALTPKGKAAPIELVIEKNTTFLFVQHSVRPRMEVGFWSVKDGIMSLVNEKGDLVADFRIMDDTHMEQLINGQPAKLASDPNCCVLTLRTDW